MSMLRKAVEAVRDNLVRSIAIRAYKKYAKKNQGVINKSDMSMEHILTMLKTDSTMLSARMRRDNSAKELIERYKAEQELVLNSNRLIESAIQIVTELGLITDPIELTINYDSDMNNGRYEYLESKIGKHKAYCSMIVVETSIGSIDSIMRQDNDDFLITINKLYDVNIDPTRADYDMLFTFLHELGHYHDCINNITRFNTKAREKQLEKAEMNYLASLLNDNLDYTEEDYSIAYRQLPDESYADRFAINILKRYYPEIVNSNK